MKRAILDKDLSMTVTDNERRVAFTPRRIMGRNMVVYIGTERSIFYHQNHQVQRVILSM